MNYIEAKEKLSQILADPVKISMMEEEFGEIDQVFIASSDFVEMYSDLDLIKENDFDAGEDLLTCRKQDFGLYVLTFDETLTILPEELY
jgi:hypothetical protein